MTCVRRFALAILVSSTVGFFRPAAGAQQPPADQAPPSALEQALIDFVCGAARVGGPGTDTYQSCLDARLLSLRTDFGRDLSRLSNAERRNLDSVCSKIRVTGGREEYVACINTQLGALRAKRNRGAPPPSEAPAAPAATPAPVGATADAPITPPPPERSIGVWIGAGVVAVLLAAVGGLALAKRPKRGARVCRTCGSAVGEGGDLCANCRHEAAESLRRASAERAEQQRAEERAKQDEQRRAVEQEEEQRREQARREDEERRQQEERARKEEEAERQRLEASRRQLQSADGADQFDPYAVLGVSAQASRGEIEAAYQQAKAKYDVEQVMGLGGEMEEHYKAKTAAIERARAMLIT